MQRPALVSYTTPRDANPAPGRSSGSLLASSRYEVLRLLPSEGSDLHYRIKAADESFERVAKEHELAYRNE